jgi:hypothetical protein
VLDQMTLYRDDAGYPGDEIGTSGIDVRGVVTCPHQSETQSLEAVVAVDLAALCVEHAATPTGSPLYVQVEVTGRATNCSAEEEPLLFRTKVQVGCETP